MRVSSSDFLIAASLGCCGEPVTPYAPYFRDLSGDTARQEPTPGLCNLRRITHKKTARRNVPLSQSLTDDA
jgi:hypothetical protein